MTDAGSGTTSPRATKAVGQIVLGWLIGSALLTTPAYADLEYLTLDYEGTSTFLTGIRGDNIVGDYVIPGTSDTGGLYYNLTSGTWSPLPAATPSGVNFPGAVSSSPYGPSFGSPSGILRAVGSYKVESSPYDLGYLYDGAAAPGDQLTTLVYPGSSTLYTIAHSTFGDTVVGNYDTVLVTGNAFVYDIPSGTFTTNNNPDAISTTAYGVWGDKIAGGYALAGEDGLEHGYIYDRTADTWTTYDHPLALVTHFEGITGGGRAGEYNLVTDWVDLGGTPHAALLHIAADGSLTWYELDVPGSTTTSANSAYGDKVIGVYLDGGSAVHGYVVSIPGIYNPIRNVTDLVVDTAGTVGLSGTPGDDIINDGSVLALAGGSVGIRGDTWGVVNNYGELNALGLGSAAVEMQGSYGTLVNYQLIAAGPGAVAIRNGTAAAGTAVVNFGTIDGLVLLLAGSNARFENSGWLGISAPGGSVTHQISGTFAQTAAGTLALRIGAEGSDLLQVTGAARLAGTAAVDFNTSELANSYILVAASEEITGSFDALTTGGLASFVDASLGYGTNEVTLNLASDLGSVAGLTKNQAAVGQVVDRLFNGGDALPEALSALFGLSAGELPGALRSLSGEIHASEQSVLINQARFGRQALLDRMRQATFGNATGAETASGAAGPQVACSSPACAGSSDAVAAAGATAGGDDDAALWAKGFGDWGSIDGDGNAASLDSSLGGFVVGADTRVAEGWRLGLALGYSRSNTTIDAAASSIDVDSLFIAGYAAARMAEWNLRLGASWAWNWIDSDRTISYSGVQEQASAQYNAGLGQVFGEISRSFAFETLALEPFAGLAWVHLSTDGFAESGGSAALKGSEESADIGYSTLGLRFATRVALGDDLVLVPHGSAAWQFAFGDLTPETALAFRGATGSFTASGVPLAANSALVDLGFGLELGPTVQLGLSYSGQFSGSTMDNAVLGSVTWQF